MTPAKYELRKGQTVKGVEAKELFNVLDGIRKDNGGRLTPEAVLIAAQPKESVLHEFFEWNNGWAAEQYRLNQARHLIANVKVRLEGDAPETRAFVNVKVSGDDKRSYTRMDIAMRSVPMREQVLDEAKKALMTWRKKYAALEELAEIFAALEPFIEFDEEEGMAVAV